MKKLNSLIPFALLFTILISSCIDSEPKFEIPERNLELPEQVMNYEDIQIPTVFVNSDNMANIFNRRGAINDNPEITNHGATLGRVLFYDQSLSLNNSVSCASCHNQRFAFADGKDVSEGFEGRKTTRNSMSIVNPGLKNNLFWDSRAHSVRAMSLEPVQNHIEMGMEDMDVLTQKLKQIDYYPELFNKAYGSTEISEEKISDAMSQFLVSMLSFDTKFDKGLENGFIEFSQLEKIGKEIFFSSETQCSGCHTGVNLGAADAFGGAYQQSQGTANIGLDLNPTDQGRGNGKFKIPSLRNVGISAPYMHDGRFNSLEQVVEHYNSGIQNHPSLDSKFIEGNSVKRLNLTDTEKAGLVAFLHTLTDHSFTVDPKYSNPFK